MPERLLVLLPRWVGDALIATPLLQLLRRRPGGAHLAVLAAPAVVPALAGLSFIDEIMTRGGFLQTAARLRRGRFDEVFVLPNSFSSAVLAALSGAPRRIGYACEFRGPLLTDARPWPGEIGHRVLRYARLADPALGRLSPADYPCAVASDEAAEAEANRLLEGLDPRRLVAVNPCSMNAPSRRWAAERFGALCRALAGLGFAPVLVGGPTLADRRRVDEVKAAAGTPTSDLCGRTSLPGLAAVLRRARLLVTGDVGLMHVGAAAGTPLLVLAGASDTSVTGPWTAAPVRILRKPVPCAPCVKNHCINRETPMICMDSIETDEVLVAAREMLA